MCWTLKNPGTRALAATRLLVENADAGGDEPKFLLSNRRSIHGTISYAGNFLHMLFAILAEPYQLNPVIEQAMNQIRVLHADHGQMRIDHNRSGRRALPGRTCLPGIAAGLRFAVGRPTAS